MPIIIKVDITRDTSPVLRSDQIIVVFSEKTWKSEMQRRSAMNVRAVEMRLQAVNLPVRGISRKAMNAAVN
jgi:hypothetical protein